MSWGYRFILIHRRWSMNIYQHLDPFRMNMCVPTYITCQPIWPTAIQPELLTLQKIATKSIPGPSQETVQAWGFLHGSSSCSVFLCRLLQSWPIRIRETVCFCSSSCVCDFNANLLILLLFLSTCAASALTAIADNWKNKPSNWNGNDPCRDKWVGIICTGNRVTSVLVSASQKNKLMVSVSSS